MADGIRTTFETLLFEQCRTDDDPSLLRLLSQVSESAGSNGRTALLNSTKDHFGCNALHIAAKHGSHHVLAFILNGDGIEANAQDVVGDTFLHKLVQFINELPSEHQQERGRKLLGSIVDCGCNPTIKNKAGMKAGDLFSWHCHELAGLLLELEHRYTEKLSHGTKRYCSDSDNDDDEDADYETEDYVDESDGTLSDETDEDFGEEGDEEASDSDNYEEEHLH